MNDCHTAHHQGERPLRDDLIAVVAARNGVMQDDVRGKMAELKWGRLA